MASRITTESPIREAVSTSSDHPQSGDIAAGWTSDLLLSTNSDFRALAGQVRCLTLNGIAIPTCGREGSTLLTNFAKARFQSAVLSQSLVLFHGLEFIKRLRYGSTSSHSAQFTTSSDRFVPAPTSQTSSRGYLP